MTESCTDRLDALLMHFPVRARMFHAGPICGVASFEAGGEGASKVLRLPDPHPDTPDRPAGARWWPPVMLRPEWARTADFDGRRAGQ